MTDKTKIYTAVALAAAVAAAILANSAWSNHKINKLESEAATLKQQIAERDKAANEKEIEAAAYKEKIEYLNAQIADIRSNARKQDEQINNATNNTARARRSVGEARRTTTVESTTDQLCSKLAELGHGCE